MVDVLGVKSTWLKKKGMPKSPEYSHVPWELGTTHQALQGKSDPGCAENVTPGVALCQLCSVPG